MYDRKEYRNLQKYSLTQIHDLWYKFDKRYKQRNQILCDYIDLIVKEIKPNKKKEYIVYYREKGKTHKYIFSKSGLGGYGFHNQKVEKDRDDSLDFFLSDEKQFEMGKEFRRLYLRASGSIRQYLKEVFLDSLRFHLRNNVKMDFWDSKILTVKIGDKKHWVKAARMNETWMDFEYISEVHNDIIKLK